MNDIILKFKSLKIKVVLKNIYTFFKYDIKQESRNSQLLLSNLQVELFEIKNELLYFKILDYHHNHPSQNYIQEISYLIEIGKVDVFPYKRLKTIKNVEYGFDNEKQMPYVIHKENRKLYFPKTWGITQAKETYLSFIEVESILGGDYLQKAPHQYQTDDFCVKNGDVVLDIGSAEALFSLEIIDIAKKVYIFESDEKWIEPLKATFEPYQDKVIIINKLVSNVDSVNSVTLESCIELDEIQSLFVKMDIEGYEKLVLEGNLAFFSKNIDLRVACCTYHRHDDADDLKEIFDNLAYKTEYSNGYMLFSYDSDLKAPYFRKGIIRAEKIKKLNNAS